MKEVVSGGRHIIIHLTPSPSDGKEEVVGVVMLDKPQTQTVPHTAWVEKLLVSPEWRRKGVTKRMMGKLEEVARSEGRLLLVSLSYEVRRKTGEMLITNAAAGYREG